MDVVRVCEPTYDKQALIDVGIALHDWPFKDGGLPPQEILQKFLALSSSRFGPLSSAQAAPPDPSGPVIAVHCVAGLGRAPVLVAVSLIEAGLTPLDAVDFIRKRRRGAFNSVQLQFLVDSYKRRNSGSSWRVGEAARAFFGRKASPSPPPLSMGSVSVQPSNQGPGPSSIAEQSNGNNSGSESPTLSVHSLKESFSKVCVFSLRVLLSLF